MSTIFVACSKVRDLLTRAQNLLVKKEEPGDNHPESPQADSAFASTFDSPQKEKDDDESSEKSYRGSGNVTLHNADEYAER